MMLNQFFNSILLVLSISSVLLLSGCNSPIDDFKPLRVGMNTWPGYEPFMLAKEKGFLAKNVNISRVDSATDVIKAFRSDIIDVACVTLDEAIILQSKIDENIKIITITDFSAGADVIITKRNISSMAMLKGKRVGIESGALGSYIISRAIDLTPNLTINDIQIINLGYEHHESEFNAGKVDAVVTFEPVKTKLLKGNAHVIFDSTQIPDEVIDVIIVKEKTIKDKSPALQALMDGWYKSIDFIKTNHEKSMSSMARYEGINLEDFHKAHNGIKIPSLSENRIFFKNKLNNTITKVEKILITKSFIKSKTGKQIQYSTQFIESK